MFAFATTDARLLERGNGCCCGCCCLRTGAIFSTHIICENDPFCRSGGEEIRFRFLEAERFRGEGEKETDRLFEFIRRFFAAFDKFTVFDKDGFF